MLSAALAFSSSAAGYTDRGILKLDNTCALLPNLEAPPSWSSHP